MKWLLIVAIAVIAFSLFNPWPWTGGPEKISLAEPVVRIYGCEPDLTVEAEMIDYEGDVPVSFTACISWNICKDEPPTYHEADILLELTIFDLDWGHRIVKEWLHQENGPGVGVIECALAPNTRMVCGRYVVLCQGCTPPKRFLHGRNEVNTCNNLLRKKQDF